MPVVPSMEEWPYVLRIVSDVLSSNGSTSMASVCGSTLSMLDGGVPLKAPVAGIAMGLVYAEGKYTTLTDILGTEDAFGDMDFKVAGTRDFVTALQLDTKIDGLPADVLRAGAAPGPRRPPEDPRRDGRRRSPTHRADVKPTAPKIISFEIPMDKIGEVIGPKGKVINTITQETGADVSVSDDGVVGTVSIGSKDGAAVEEARRRIELILDPPTAELGAEYTGKVVNVTKFGAFVNILPGRDGLLHISKLGRGKRIDRVEDVLNLGDEVTVRVDDIDNSGKLSLSLAGDEPARASGVRHGRRRAATASPAAAPRPRRRATRTVERRRRRPTSRSRRSTTPGTRRPGRSSATSVRPRSVVPVVATAGSARWRRWSPARRPAVTARAEFRGCRSSRDRQASMTAPMVDDASGIRRTRLDSGLRVVTEHLPGLRSVGGRVLGGHGLARRAGGDRGRQPLPRAPAVQGHRHAPRGGDRGSGRVGAAAT